MNPRPGEVWLADLGMAAKTRPVVVVSRYDEDPPCVLVLYVPLTSEDRGSESEVEMPKLPFLRLEGVANVQGIASLGREKAGASAGSPAGGSNGTNKEGAPLRVGFRLACAVTKHGC